MSKANNIPNIDDLDKLSKNQLFNMLQDIRGYYAIEIPLYVLIILGLIIAGVIGYFVYKKFFYKKEVRVISVFERTITSLNRLDVGLLSKEFYLEFSELVKIYLETEFGHPLLDKTTEEVKEVLKEDPFLTTAQVINITDSLAKGDLAKFALKELSETDKARDINSMVALLTEVNRTVEAKKIYEEVAKRDDFIEDEFDMEHLDRELEKLKEKIK